MTGIGSSCGACRFLRRKCSSKCIFSPYFSYDVAVHHFAAVHKVFGASNASRLLQKIPEQYRNEAARALSYEALARIQDPVYGCIGHIYALQQQVVNLQEEIEILGNFLAVGMTSSAGSGAENDNAHGLHRTSQATTLNIPECMNYEEQQVSNYLLNQQSTLMIQPGNELDNQALRILDPSSSTFEGEIQYSTSCYRWLASGIPE